MLNHADMPDPVAERLEALQREIEDIKKRLEIRHEL